MTETRFLDVHVLQPVPPNNLNRDNNGQPKNMVYGGTTRSRISSQCLKRALRMWLESNSNLEHAIRSRRLPELVRAELAKLGVSDDSKAVAAVKIAFYAMGIAVQGGETADDPLSGNQLTFTPKSAAGRIATALNDSLTEVLAAAEEFGVIDSDGALSEKGPSGEFKKNRRKQEPWRQVAEAFTASNAVIALCGRMLADHQDSSVDAALQVGHSFTTNTATTTVDWFTAVDDQAGDDSGAAHIGNKELMTGVLYRHLTVNVANLSQEAVTVGDEDEQRRAVSDILDAVVRAFVFAEPSGMQNTANAHTMPVLVNVEARSDRPSSKAGAFERPVAAERGGGHTATSIGRLDEWSAAEADMLGTDGIVGSWVLLNRAAYPDPLNGPAQEVKSMDDLLAAMAQAV